MTEFKTPVKKVKTVDSNEKITIPPSPFLNRLGYGTGMNLNFCFSPPNKCLLDKISLLLQSPCNPKWRSLILIPGVNVMQLVRSPRAGQIRSPWALKMLNKRVKPSRVYSERIQAEADLLQKMSHPNIVGFRAFSKTKILYLGMEACDISLGDMIEKRVEENGAPYSPREILKVHFISLFI